MRAIFKKTDTNTVTMHWSDGDERGRREFYCPRNGGYVREITRFRDDPQVCEHLSHRGVTLIANSGDDLLSVLRNEWRKIRRYERARS